MDISITTNNLLTFKSTKILKGEKLGYKTGVMYFKPADSVAPKTLCPFAKRAGCYDICLQDSGHLGMSSGQLAMTRRTLQYLADPDGFKERLRAEILKHQTDNYAIRLNGTSDIDWSDVISSLPDIRFYDYTKILKRIDRNSLGNYHLTYSGSFKMLKKTREAIKSGYNVALAFNSKEAKGDFKIPDSITIDTKVIPLVSFDETDLRFLDAPGSVGYLTRKGSNLEQRQSEIGTKNFFGDLITLKLLEA